MQEWSSMYRGLGINRNMLFEKFKGHCSGREVGREVGEVSRCENEESTYDVFKDYFLKRMA